MTEIVKRIAKFEAAAGKESLVDLDQKQIRELARLWANANVRALRWPHRKPAA